MNHELGADIVRASLVGAFISAVNYSEVMKKTIERSVAVDTLHALVKSASLEIVPFDTALAEASARLYPETKAHGMSFADPRLPRFRHTTKRHGPTHRQGHDYFKLLNSTISEIDAAAAEQDETVRQVSGLLPNLRSSIDNANRALATPENRIAELIKRLGLGIVVSTFFLAILRYLGNLYRARYEQVVAADKGDFMVRRFYVALKNSTAGGEQRNAVLTGFMTGSPSLVAAEPDGADDTSKQSLELIKELLAALTKKL
jgi:hypothetical protein